MSSREFTHDIHRTTKTLGYTKVIETLQSLARTKTQADNDFATQFYQYSSLKDIHNTVYNATIQNVLRNELYWNYEYSYRYLRNINNLAPYRETLHGQNNLIPANYQNRIGYRSVNGAHIIAPIIPINWNSVVFYLYPSSDNDSTLDRIFQWGGDSNFMFRLSVIDQGQQIQLVVRLNTGQLFTNSYPIIPDYRNQIGFSFNRVNLNRRQILWINDRYPYDHTLIISGNTSPIRIFDDNPAAGQVNPNYLDNLTITTGGVGIGIVGAETRAAADRAGFRYLANTNEIYTFPFINSARSHQSEHPEFFG